jgi:hypothetical protein
MATEYLETMVPDTTSQTRASLKASEVAGTPSLVVIKEKLVNAELELKHKNDLIQLLN